MITSGMMHLTYTEYTGMPSLTWDRIRSAMDALAEFRAKKPGVPAGVHDGF